MGYKVSDIIMARNEVIANGVALFLAFAINYSSQLIAILRYKADSKERALVLERILESSRVLFWFGIATAFSIFPPFYYGMPSVALGWITLAFVLLMHIFCFVRNCDHERSLWSYWYFFFHVSVLVWIVMALILGYYWSGEQPQATDINEY